MQVNDGVFLETFFFGHKNGFSNFFIQKTFFGFNIKGWLNWEFFTCTLRKKTFLDWE
jgi:hypothetical protein